MRIKNFLFLLLGLAVVACCVWFYTENRTDLDRTVGLFGWETSVLLLLVLAFVAGAVFFGLFWFVREVGIFKEGWVRNREMRHRAAIEARFREGADAVVHRRYREAEDAFRSVLEREPEHRDALIALGDTLRAQDRVEEAAECHRKAVRLDEKDLKAHYCLAEDLLAAGDLSAAEGVLRRIIDLRPKRSVAAHEQLRDLHARRGLWEQALEVQGQLERLSHKNPERQERIRRTRLGLEYEVALREIRDGDSKSARSRLKKLLKKEPAFTPAYVALGEASRNEGRDDEAVSWYREGFSETGSPIFLRKLEDHFLSRQDPGSAISAFKDLVEARASDVLPRFFLGRLYNRLEMNEEAWDVFTALQAEQPDSPTISYYVARVHERRGEYEEACRLYRKVVQETDGLRIWYRCTGCEKEVAGWQPYCEACRAWDTFQVEWAEPIPPEKLDVREVRPVWTAVDPVVETA